VRAVIGLLYRPSIADGDDDCGAVGSMDVDWPGKSQYREKTCPSVHHKSHMTVKNGVFWDVTPCGSSSQKTPFFIVTAVKTSNLTHMTGSGIEPGSARWEAGN
jgi:hypothetical protein